MLREETARFLTNAAKAVLDGGYVSAAYCFKCYSENAITYVVAGGERHILCLSCGVKDYQLHDDIEVELEGTDTSEPEPEVPC
jgi:hypothetical protein